MKSILTKRPIGDPILRNDRGSILGFLASPTISPELGVEL